ncbi:MAG: CinA family nicotinamide mononucleotide deamidase-related protein, partial [Clostridia bacterium]|nr:CinA family nicotinamide mononucleotide deamidase-related protein [Clostridia bacterium]
MNAEIINVGTELLIGDTIAGSQQFLVSELANIDINVYCTNTAGFDPIRLRELLSIALSRSDIILIVGGMGPNAEDITKQTVCDALGLTMVPHDISRKRIEEYCRHNGIPITDDIMSMANMPAGSVVFLNDNGMCPGCAIRSSKQCIVMLPSSTVEITPMVRSYVIQYLKQLTDGAVFSQVINVFYIGISLHEVEQRLGNLLTSTNPTVRCFEMTGEVRIRVTARTGTEQMSRDMAAPVIRQIIEIFGDDAYGMNVSGLEEVVVRELKERKMTLSTAESCTAGIISKRITDIPGSSRVFEMGAATYSSNKKSDMLGVSEKIIQRFGAVSPEAAAAMAVGARRLAGSSLGISTTGIAGPGGGTALKPVGLVYIALADKENVWIRKTLIQKPGMDRDYVRQVAASHALNMVRMYMNSLPYLMPGYEPLGEGVRESYFDDTTALSPQAMRNLAASVPVASLGIDANHYAQQDPADAYINGRASQYGAPGG